MEKSHPFAHLETSLTVGADTHKMFNINKYLEEKKLPHQLPYCIRVLLESAIRNCDDFNIKPADVENILNWKETSEQDIEVPFKPARVILQDFTGVPAVVDLAAMRTTMKELGGDPNKINPLCQVDLVIDHSVQVDVARDADAKEKNEEIEFNRNQERFAFLKWGEKAFENFRIVPPGNGIVHQVNLEWLARVAFVRDGHVYPDSVVGTDSHTTMIDGLGVVGWGVGGIEAESVMLGQQISMVLPKVVGFKLVGELPAHTTATDLVLTCTAMLRKRGVVGQFVEFFGEGCRKLSLTDRATVANMSPEYGATMGFFPVDAVTIGYLRQTGAEESRIELIEKYFKASGLFRTYAADEADPIYTGEIMELDLSSVKPSLSGPKRPHDHVHLDNMQKDFKQCLSNKVGFKGFDIAAEKQAASSKFSYKGEEHELKHGSIVIAAITSCTNTSNPHVMLQAGMLARNAVKKGLKTPNYLKTSLSPGSGVVTSYLNSSGVSEYLDKLGFTTAGYGCMTCIGNSGEIPDEVTEAINAQDLVVSAVLSGNRNFEGRVHPMTRANYLASPPLVVAYALAGTVDIDFETQPIGKDAEGKDVFLKDVWPTREEVDKVVLGNVTPAIFKDFYSNTLTRNQRWNNLVAPQGSLFTWTEDSTYVHLPPFFAGMTKDVPASVNPVKDAYCLLNLPDSITTDHISPAGNISKTSSAAKYLNGRGVGPKDFNSYGARRGHDEVMARGTFANVRLVNKLVEKPGPNTIHVPSGEQMSIFDASARYIADGHPLVVLAGKEYGSGSSRDWAAKGPYLQGIKVVIAQSYERIHRSNLLGMGILPLQFKNGESADSLGFNGKETFSFELGDTLRVGQDVNVTASNGKTFTALCRLDTDPEVAYYMNGGILRYVLRKLI